MLRPETKSIQSKMAAYCREPEFTDAIEGSKPGRLHNYRRLVFNIIEDTLADAYPITRSMMDDEEWIDMVNAFFSKHNCQSTQLWRMPFELVEFVENHEYHTKIGRPYLLELLYFEWLEIEVYQSPDK
ncbi:MAG TPA: putative DNA-binding domain-containing protein, partial [Flavobacteriales bacterium]|nr:putative DNA-binding domain-containing protein [Flavobacteriales bacterium]